MKRYDYDRITEGIRETPAGDYVLYQDYAALQRRLAAAKNTLEQIAESYPETDEGETLASLARDALKELAK